MAAQLSETTVNINGTIVLVTGGSGFIGRATCRLLMAAGAQVVNLDTNSWPGPDRGPTTVLGNIEDASKLASIITSYKPTILIHLAAFASVTLASRQDFSSIWNGTRVVAEAFRASSDCKRMVNISTQLVIRPGPQPNDLRQYDPYTAYGAAKTEAEVMLDQMDRVFEVVHVRPANIWGPHHPSYASSIMRYIEKGWYLHPMVSQPILRTYGYVDNCAAQIVSAALMEGISEGSIFYAGDEVLDSADFLDAMSRGLRGTRLRRFPMGPLRVVAGLGTQLRKLSLPFPFDRERLMRMSTDYIVPLRATREIALFAEVPFDVGIRHTVKWYKDGARSSWHEG